ncbi:MAG: GNAT family N-acetyltransferase, partial [bacterium]|nr:GNAT family N-acetyltransferase [bacterium]
MSDILVKAVESAKEMEQFIRLPWAIYRNDSSWVPPLIAEQKKMLDAGHNPFFQHARAAYFLASRNGEVLGRISAHVDDNSNKFHGEKCGFFGFFESVDDPNVAKALFAAAEKWARENGMDTVRGPFNFTTNDTAGLLVDAFDRPPVIEMTYNPPYYPALVESCGYAKVMDLLAYFLDVQNIDRSRIKMLARRAEQKGITFRSVNKKVFEQEVKIFKEVYNQAWSQNWGFVPLTEAEIDHYAKSFKDIVEPDYVIFAFDGEKPVGSLWALPDYNYALKRLNGKMGPWEMIKFLWHKRQITHTRVM